MESSGNRTGRDKKTERDPSRATVFLLVAAFCLSLSASWLIAGFRGEPVTDYYETTLNRICDTRDMAFNTVFPHPLHPIYKSFFEKNFTLGSRIVLFLIRNTGLPMHTVVVMYTVLGRALLGFSFFCLVFALSRNRALAFAIIPLAYVLEPFRAVYGINPVMSVAGLITLYLFITALALWLCGRRGWCFALLVFMALMHPVRFVFSAPLFIAMWLAERPGALKKLLPAALVLFPVAVAVAWHIIIERGLAANGVDKVAYWNLLIMRSNHGVFTGGGRYPVLIQFVMMLAGCLLAMRLPAAGKHPALCAATRVTAWLSAGLLIVQIVGVEMRLSIGAHMLLPLRIDDVLLILAFSHTLINALDGDASLRARLFAAGMFLFLAMTRDAIFSYAPMALPLWALLQVHLSTSSNKPAGAELRGIAIYVLALVVLLWPAMPPRIYEAGANALLSGLLMCGIVAVLYLACRGASLLPAANYGFTALLALTICLFGVRAFLTRYAGDYETYLKAARNTIGFVRRDPPGSPIWAESLAWIHGHIHEDEAILVYPTLYLEYVVQRRTSLDYNCANFFIYVPESLNPELRELKAVYGIDPRQDATARLRLYDLMIEQWPAARHRVMYGAAPAPFDYDWIAEPADTKPHAGVQPEFENSVLRIYHARGRHSPD